MIPLARQQRLEDLAHDLFVVDDQNGTVAAHGEDPVRSGYPAYELLTASAGRSAAHGRKRQDEPRALPDRAVAVDRAVVLAHDAVGDRQAEAGALADRLGREERIVDAGEVLARNPGAGVGHFGDRAVAVERAC